MNSNMRLRCVMLFAIYSFGLIILLDAGNASDEKSSELKRVKQSEEAEPLDEEKILLDAGSPLDEKSSELKRVKQSEEAEPLNEEKILLDAGNASDEKSSDLKRMKQSEEAEPLDEEKILLDAGNASDEKSSDLKRMKQSEEAEPLDEEKILLDAGNASDEKSSELKRVNQSEEAEPLDEEKILLDAGNASDEKSSELKRVNQSEEAEPLDEEKIKLDAGSASNEKCPELMKLVKLSDTRALPPLYEEKRYEVSDDNDDPIDNLKRMLLEPSLTRCFIFDNNTGRYDTNKLHPLYQFVVEHAARDITFWLAHGEELLIIATQSMVLELKYDMEWIEDKKRVDNLWENNKEFTGDEKERLLNQIKGIIKIFVKDVKRQKNVFNMRLFYST
ncbi:uncharacterized protein LOC126846503 isoform X16 [Adelges cooleyi]|uniref:uncharacterized protein LOC126846503 isoform X12 n=1 Tax=Adelges cooleyi TaxID=133065 RepID=UPI00217FB079|nr:uncharacterized protein LOC126846503 isoform X12 [Adelges cooleyi]XP_050441908.1 uncharacterized protein LOC126846503 isoform X13 [Adelges cooleyi]XP_050441909.1 uncharacterized protein LOC126846503 isoform X14 [Adelges cooleyi]XP_050441910.1 uncharacterized protein LOC126846503 isoform X15 [Adelges cooleyi]XP_050441911.1 uncharacterized protein LOC126846503 isoform X16 [Adelges cooleyi]